MSDQQFFIMKEDLVQLINDPERQKPEGKELLGFVLRPGTNSEGKETYYPDALFSDRPKPTGETEFDLITKATETKVCPYPPGYGNDNGIND